MPLNDIDLSEDETLDDNQTVGEALGLKEPASEPEIREPGAKPDPFFGDTEEQLQAEHLSRRERAKRERAETLKNIAEIREDLNKRERTWAEERSRLEQEVARLSGFAAATAAQRQAAPAGPTPEQLEQEALADLEKGDLRGYHAKLKTAMAAEIAAKLPRQEVSQQTSNGLPWKQPELNAMWMRNDVLVTGGAKAQQLAIAKDMELAALGVPEGTERSARAFALAADMLSKKTAATARPAFSKASAAITTASGSSDDDGGDDDDGGLSPEADKWRKMAGMTVEQYKRAQRG